MQIGTVKYERKLWGGSIFYELCAIITDSPYGEFYTDHGEKMCLGVDTYIALPSGFYSLTKTVCR